VPARLAAIAFLVAACASTTPTEPPVPDATAAAPDASIVAANLAAELPLFADDATNAAFASVDADPTSTSALAKVSHVTFGSGANDSAGAGPANALLVEPVADGLHPAVLMLPDVPGSLQDLLPRALDLANAGVISLVIDPGAQPITFWQPDQGRVVNAVLELRAGLAILANRPNVDQDAIGFLGMGAGASIGGIFAGVEPQLAAAVLESGAGASAGHESDALAPLWFVGHASGAVLFQAGRQDTVTPPLESARFGAAGNAQSSITWYDAGHDLDAAAACDAAMFLGDHLGFAGNDVTACGAAPPSNDPWTWFAIIGIFALMVGVRLYVRMRQRPPGPPPPPPSPSDKLDEEAASRPIIRPAEDLRSKPVTS
jgi:dienelactone hydrolase